MASTEPSLLVAEEFVSACAAGSLKAVERGLSLGANAGVATAAGMTALMAASAGGHLTVCKHLLHAAGPPGFVNCTDGTGSTALSHAAAAGHHAVCSLLVSQGAWIGGDGDVGSLEHAARGGHQLACDVFFKVMFAELKGQVRGEAYMVMVEGDRGCGESEGVFFEVFDRGLLAAVKWGHFALVKWFISKCLVVSECLTAAYAVYEKGGAKGSGDKEVHVRYNAKGALDEAVKGGHMGIAAYLISVAGGASFLNSKRFDSPYDESHLHIAAGAGDINMCKLLLKAGAKQVTSRKPSYYKYADCAVHHPARPLGAAALHGHTSVAQLLYTALLVEVNGDEAAVAAEVQLAAQAAACGGQVDLWDWLVTKGALGPVAACDVVGAAAAGHTAMIAHMVSRGADPHAADSDGVTALHVAADHAQLDSCRYLALTCGCNVRAVTTAGDTPLHYAARGFGNIGRGGVRSAEAYARAGELCNWLVLHGADVNAANIAGESALFTAVAATRILGYHFVSHGPGASHVVTSLIGVGADVRAVGATGETIVHTALRCGLGNIAAALAAEGASVDGLSVGSSPTGGKTALQVANEWRGVAVSQALVAAGASFKGVNLHQLSTTADGYMSAIRAAGLKRRIAALRKFVDINGLPGGGTGIHC